MSLYTPVFPPFHESNSLRNGSLEDNSMAPLGKQQNYVKYLRDVHLFLSTQSEVLSPPSRPSSPMLDHRVQKVKERIQDIFNATEGETPSRKWTRGSQVLKLGCVRGRYWSASQADPYPPEQNASWILPDEESEWIEWEKKREENRRLKGMTNASQQIDSTVSTAADLQKASYPSFARRSQPHDMSCYRPPLGVSPGTLRAAKEKVRKWQVSVVSEVSHNTARSSSSASSRELVAAAGGKRETAWPQRSRTLDFAVTKPAAKMFVGKSGKGSVPHPAIRGDSAPIPPRKSKSPKPPETSKVPQDTTPVDVDKPVAKGPADTPLVEDDAPKIADVPETPYLPPSFPAHLETSTPLANPKALVRAKPSPILPALLSMPLPSTSADPPDDRHLVSAEPHVANVTSSLPPQINTVQQVKRSRASSTSVDSIPDDPPVTPPVKRPRILSQNSSPSAHKPILPSGDLNTVPYTPDKAQDPSPRAASSRRYPMDSLGMAFGVPLTPVTGTDLPEKIPSPTKSVKSYFSAPDSDPADSPMKANLLLESPVSPMLSYAQNPSIFLPQVTSTQVRKGSPTASRINNGIFGVGYSSQFDVERHVDRVSELLEKDVDFDGWLRDIRTVETSQD